MLFWKLESVKFSTFLPWKDEKDRKLDRKNPDNLKTKISDIEERLESTNVNKAKVDSLIQSRVKLIPLGPVHSIMTENN